MEHIDEDTSGYIAQRLLGDDSDAPSNQPLHTMSLRLPMEMAAYVIEMASSADTSRNEMARLLLQAGVDSVLARLPAEVAYDTREAARERLRDMMAEG